MVAVAAVVAVVSAIAAAVSAVAGGTVKAAEVNAFNTVEDANVYSANLVRESNNELKGARASLQRYVQSENNNRVLSSTGKALEAQTINARRNLDKATANSFESQIASAEQQGAQAAAGAFSGLTGGAIDMANSATALRRSRLEFQSKQALEQSKFDAGKNSGALLQQGWDNLDHSDIGVTLDYNHNVAQHKVYSGTLFSELMSSFNPSAAQAFGSSFMGSNTNSNYDAFKDQGGSMGNGDYGQTHSITGGR